MGFTYPDNLITVEPKETYAFSEVFELSHTSPKMYVSVLTGFPKIDRFPGVWTGDLLIHNHRIWPTRIR